jgi:hypothetical protein
MDIVAAAARYANQEAGYEDVQQVVREVLAAG